MIPVAMIGGGPGSFIGKSHRLALRYDREFELVAAAFSRSPQNNQSQCESEAIDPQRCYASWSELIARELERADRIQAVIIATPNDTHYEIAAAALKAGFHVICDKPLAMDTDQAEILCELSRQTNRILALTHCYVGYPLVSQARHMVQTGALGQIRLVQVEHASGWASTALEKVGHKQAEWRMDPEIVGPSAVLMDLGTHAHHLARYITGCEVIELSADLMSLVPGRKTHDNAHINLKLSNGVRGQLWASMVANGNEHGLEIRIYGSAGSLAWSQISPNELYYRRAGMPAQVFTKGNEYLCERAQASSRIGAGHPGGYHEAFANLYRDAAKAINGTKNLRKSKNEAAPLPDVFDGLAGLKFVEAAVRSNDKAGAWTKLDGVQS